MRWRDLKIFEPFLSTLPWLVSRIISSTCCLCEAEYCDTYWEPPKGVQRFSFQDLEKATGGFSKDHEIGAGGFGKVFYGNFPDGRTLAIKRASETGSQGISEFRNEVGACSNHLAVMIVYELNTSVTNAFYHRRGTFHENLCKDLSPRRGYRSSLHIFLSWCCAGLIAKQASSQELSALRGFLRG